MKRIVTLIAALCVLLACSGCGDMGITFDRKDKKTVDGTDNTSWSVFVYMCGNNNGRASQAIEEMCALKYTENVNIVVQTGGSNGWDINGMSPDYIQRFEMQKGAPLLVDQKPDANMGDYNTLTEFLDWGTKTYPAKKNVLVLMGEGDGLTVLRDERYNNESLSIEDVYYSVSLCGVIFDIIGFDGGNMASVEMAAALSPYGKYMIADEEMGIGWDWGHLAQCIIEYPYVSERELAQIIVDRCYAKALDTGWGKMINMSVIDLSRISDVVQSFNAIASGMYEQTDSVDAFGALQRNINTAMCCVGADDRLDIGSLAKAAQNSIGEGAALMEEALSGALVYRAIGDYRRDSSGISVFYPREVNEERIASYMECATSDSYKKYIKCISPYINAHDDYVTQDYNTSGAWKEYREIPLGGTAYTNEASKFCFTIEPDMRAVCDVHINRYMYYGDTDSYYSIGDDAGIDCMWEECTYADNMVSKTLMLRSVPLDVHKRDEGASYKLYTAPVIVDDVLSDMYIAYSQESGRYELLGVFRNGSYMQISRKNRVTPVYRVYESNRLLTGKTVKGGLGFGVRYKNLKNGTYIYEYELKDIYNRLYKSGVCFMDKKGANETLR